MLGMIARTGATLGPIWPRSDTLSFCMSMHIRAVCLGSTNSSRVVSTSIPSITFIGFSPVLAAGDEDESWHKAPVPFRLRREISARLPA